RVQAGSAHATSLLRTDAVLARDARYQRVDLELGAGLSRHELNVRLEGNNAQLTANGVLLGNGRRHVDTRLGIEHIARDTA
ncbi:SufD family Fe-S cluster assembly protein, partial [Xanthomonas citri]